MLFRSICGGLQPDLTLLLLSDVKKAVNRARVRNDRNKHKADEGRFEMERSEFYSRVYKTYLHIARRDSKRVVKIAASRPIQNVQTDVWAAVKERLHR